VKKTIAIPLAVAVSLTVAAVAAAAVYGPGIPSRQQYVAKSETVCAKTDSKQGTLTAAAAKSAKAGNAKRAGKQFAQVAAAFNHGVGQLAKLPKPTADRGLLNKWLASMRGDVALLNGEAKAYKAGDATKLAALGKAAHKHAAVTNGIVRGFGFKSCLVGG
jgi:hypothetical protein